MALRHSGRLELTWTNKDKTLLAHEDGSYEWVDPADYRVNEVRLLHEVGSVGDGQPDNLLIRGDALHALTALSRLPHLAKKYAGKVKLVYIDPPFNTGQAFTQYDDALEHSVWLTMFRDRLRQIKPLLSDDGSVWVHLDDAEVHRARAVMDEEFGAENFAGCIIWEKADSPRNSARQFSTDHDCILVYGKREDWTPFKLSRTSASDSIYTNPDNDPRGPWLPGDPYANKPYSRGLYTVTGPTGRQFQPPAGRYWRISNEKLRALDDDGRVWWGPNGSARPSIKRYLSEVADLVPRTLWSRHDVGSNRTSKNEMRALFAEQATFATPKPERLMQRIIQIATQPGDIVLDCFAGSGTTAAVAHKMGRGWVIAEWSAETVATFTLPRLTRVVAGEDPGGITSVDTPTGDGLPDSVKPGSAKAAASVLDALAKAGQLDGLELVDATGISELVKALRGADKTSRETLWSGGGGFTVADVGPSMFDVVDGRVYLADWASNGALAQAVAAQLGYDFEVDEPFAGTKGKTRLAVVDGLVNEDVIRLLIDALPVGQKLCVCGTAIDPAARDALRDLRPGSTMRKVPAALLDEYRMTTRHRGELASRLDWSAAEALLNAPVDADATAGA